MHLIIAFIVGLATYYNQGVMHEVRTNRGMECESCVGYIALIDCDTLGDTFWLRRPGHIAEGPFLQADCASPVHADYLRKRGWAVDVDWDTSRRWNMHGPLANVQVIPDYEYRHMRTSRGTQQ